MTAAVQSNQNDRVTLGRHREAVFLASHSCSPPTPPHPPPLAASQLREQRGCCFTSLAFLTSLFSCSVNKEAFVCTMGVGRRARLIVVFMKQLLYISLDCFCLDCFAFQGCETPPAPEEALVLFAEQIMLVFLRQKQERREHSSSSSHSNQARELACRHRFAWKLYLTKGPIKNNTLFSSSGETPVKSNIHEPSH